MNKAIIMGRVCKDPELRYTQSQNAVCSFTLAVDRRYKNADGSKTADFIPIVAWRQSAEFVHKYFRKGSRMAVVGTIQIRSWDDDQGNKRYATEVIAEEIHFGESKQQQAPTDSYQPQPNAPDNGFFPAPDDDTSLPFEL